MSYAQFQVTWSGVSVGGRCVNPYDPEAFYPEHREDERRPLDAIFNVSPGDFGEHPLSPVVPENPCPLKFLTFSSLARILD